MVLQFPIYWYSSPSILKEWQDLVLEFGWAYGPGGTHLHGKKLVLAVTLGGARDAYGPDGQNFFDLRTLLAPFDESERDVIARFLAHVAEQAEEIVEEGAA